ncbi:MAG TPA: hypothetical protein VKF82_01610 [Candidatus Eremiobacteraceae bacterium]|nr:hypothetical protein [Candidatus Eremiobacteraceae bacterium]
MLKKIAPGLYATIAALFITTNAVAADPTPAPSPVASSAPQAPAQTAPAIPKNFDPCGGPIELSSKLGNGTACVFVLGEAALTAQYASANIPANTQINFMGNTLNLSGYAHAFGYPAPVVYVGVAPRAQIVITPPSFVQVNAGKLGTLAAGTSDMQFEYKQLLYVNLPKFTMVALDLAYKAPTGSQLLRGPGPEYTINPIITQPLPHNFGVTIAFPVNNFTVSCLTCSSTSRGWSISPTLTPYWETPSGTLVALVVQHSFNPSTTPVAFSVGQQFGRHFFVSATEGGFTHSSSRSGPFFGLVNASSTAYPSLFSVNVNYLFGRSDLPAALMQ